MRRCMFLLLLAAVLTASSSAFADAQTVNFRALMLSTSRTYVGLVSDHPFKFLTPDGYWEDGPEWAANPDYDDYVHEWEPPCDNNSNGIPDVSEFAVLSAIFANASHPLHEELHEAYKVNWARAGTDLGGLQASLAPDIKYIMGAYVTLGDGAYQSQVISNVRYGWGFQGSWGIYAEAVYGMAGYGSNWPPAKGSAPVAANYSLKPLLASACADPDGDGVKNIEEFYGNGGVYTGLPADPLTQTDDLTLSLAAEAAYVAAALSAGTTTNGGDPADVCAGDSGSGWTWGRNIWYYPANGYVYVAGPTMPWTPAQYWAQNFTIGSEKVAVVGNLASVDSEALNAWMVTNIMSVVGADMLVGGTDSATEGNWKWIGTGVQFWSGKGSGATPPGVPVGTEWHNWNGPGEPNDSSGEDYMEMKTNGTWNDNKADNDEIALVEFSNGGAGYADSNSNGYPDFWEAYVTAPVPAGPKAQFSATPVSGDMPLDVDFTDLSTAEVEGYAITGWAWDFGDGGTSVEQNPSHIYATDGTYTVSLTITATMAGQEDLTDTETKTGYITVNYACGFEGQLTFQGETLSYMLLNTADPLSDGLLAILTGLGQTSWALFDWEGLEANLVAPPAPSGDGLPDAIQMALIERVACNTSLDAQAVTFAGLSDNKALFLADVATLAALDAGFAPLAFFADYFAGMIGSSAEMKDTVNAIFLALTEGAVGLPSYASYVVIDDAKAGELFSASGDLDADGRTNLEEYTEVMATTCNDVETVLSVITDPDNFYPCNENLPVAGIVGLGLLVGSILTGAGFALRKK